MKTTLRKVYQCEFCDRNMLSAGAMSWHEKHCTQNPNNWHKCFKYCVHLDKKIETFDEYDEDGCLINRYSITHFSCRKTDTGLYSFKLEKQRPFNPEWIKDLERMPLECSLYEHDKNNPF